MNAYQQRLLHKFGLSCFFKKICAGTRFRLSCTKARCSGRTIRHLRQLGEFNAAFDISKLKQLILKRSPEHKVTIPA